ncbi:MAG: DUF5060 domain-containing protein [Opitutales bacterium]
MHTFYPYSFSRYLAKLSSLLLVLASCMWAPCVNALVVYKETGGVLMMDNEFAPAGDRWAVGPEDPDATPVRPTSDDIVPNNFGDYFGENYYMATQNDFQNPGRGQILDYPFILTTASRYQFQMRSMIGIEDTRSPRSEHNDLWMRLLDQDGNSIERLDLVDNHNSAIDYDDNGEPWYKVYMNKNNRWVWDTRNVDGNGQPLYWDLEAGQVYTIQISARSRGHCFDRLMMWDRYGDVIYGKSGNGNGETYPAGHPNEGEALADYVPVSEIVDLSASSTVTGELKRWHKVTINFEGPDTSESATPNPFLDYRLDVTFRHADTGKIYTVPGYYAADGDAANTGATGGNIWRAHFAPDEIGDWSYAARFLEGTNVAGLADPTTIGAASSYIDGIYGKFTVDETDKSGRDFRGKGRLQYVGGHYLQHAGSGEYFLKQGADSPENFLAYSGFDGNWKTDGYRDDIIKDWAPHVQDWVTGDPSWGGGVHGKGIIGAINYLASEGLNGMSFLTFNVGGDDQNVFPHIDYGVYDRMDVSKLDQWGIVLDHATHQGMFMDFKTQEKENEIFLDNGDVGTHRTLYYRELVARFGHNLGLMWNLGEENGIWNNTKNKPEEESQTTEQRHAMADWFNANDPYGHHIVLHNGQPGWDMLGPDSSLTGFSLQTTRDDFSRVPTMIANYISRSVQDGKPWVVTCDEPGQARTGVRPDSDPGNSHEDGRRNAMWGCIMNQGAGSDYYFGYDYDHSDLFLTDYRSRDNWWDYARYTLEFFDKKDRNGAQIAPFWELTADHTLISDDTVAWCMANLGKTYLVFIKDHTNTITLDLSAGQGRYDVFWYNPRTGGDLQTGSVASVTGGNTVDLGASPDGQSADDWVVVVREEDLTGTATGLSLIDTTDGSVIEGYADLQEGQVINLWELPSSVGFSAHIEILANFEGQGFRFFSMKTLRAVAPSPHW